MKRRQSRPGLVWSLIVTISLVAGLIVGGAPHASAVTGFTLGDPTVSCSGPTNVAMSFQASASQQVTLQLLIPVVDAGFSDYVNLAAGTDGPYVVQLGPAPDGTYNYSFDDFSGTVVKSGSIVVHCGVDVGMALVNPSVDCVNHNVTLATTATLDVGASVGYWVSAPDGVLVDGVGGEASTVDAYTVDLTQRVVNNQVVSVPFVDGQYTYMLSVGTAWQSVNVPDGTFTVSCSQGPGTTVYDQFVKAAYQDFLGRAPTATELAAKAGPLAAGTLSKEAFLATMANSDEWLNAIVTKMYVDTLGRQPDAAGLAGWTTFLRNKTFTVADVASRFYASDEYYLYHAGGTPTLWVTALYQKLLNRTPDPAGLSGWVAYTTSPSWGRARVAFEFYQSLESRLKRVDALYQVLLGRGPDATGWPFWADVVRSTGDITLAVSLADSEEYWLRAKVRF
jgi:hypothetical protein